MLSVLLSVAMFLPVDAPGLNYTRFRPSEVQLRSLEEPAYAACIHQSGGITVSMRDCNAQEFRRLDGLLNREYRAALARLASTQARLRLRQTQRAWLATRWSECDRRVSHEGGTLATLSRDTCAIAEVSRRVLWLRTYE
jgi:uncharacterized protein YecT (DUF1311 family)